MDEEKKGQRDWPKLLNFPQPPVFLQMIFLNILRKLSIIMYGAFFFVNFETVFFLRLNIIETIFSFL